jgi:hypothetical protein
MHIAEIAPLAESVPPSHYGEIERVVSWLTDELVGLGDKVTLFASGGSKTKCAPPSSGGARLVAWRNVTGDVLPG